MASILMYYFDLTQMGGLNSFTYVALPSLLGVRMLLNMRAAGEATRVMVSTSAIVPTKIPSGYGLDNRDGPGGRELSEIRFA